MKNIGLAILGLLLSVNFTIAQEIERGHIKLEFTEVKPTNQEDMMSQALVGSTIDIFYSETKNLTVMNIMGGMMTMKNLTDLSSGKMDILFDMMGSKMHVESNKSETETNKPQKNIKVVTKAEDTKTILGHLCVKKILMDPNTNEPMAEMYVTNDVKVEPKLLPGLPKTDMKGFPLELKMKLPQMSITVTAKEVNEEINDSKFEVNKAGYTKTSYKDFQQMMGAMGGSFGL